MNVRASLKWRLKSNMTSRNDRWPPRKSLLLREALSAGVGDSGLPNALKREKLRGKNLGTGDLEKGNL